MFSLSSGLVLVSGLGVGRRDAGDGASIGGGDVDDHMLIEVLLIDALSNCPCLSQLGGEFCCGLDGWSVGVSARDRKDRCVGVKVYSELDLVDVFGMILISGESVRVRNSRG
ncbi:hypothetical protein Tco_1361554 [Tanacetum coccineum]